MKSSSPSMPRARKRATWSSRGRNGFAYCMREGGTLPSQDKEKPTVR
jgi:hypothetical protein